MNAPNPAGVLVGATLSLPFWALVVMLLDQRPAPPPQVIAPQTIQVRPPLAP